MAFVPRHESVRKPWSRRRQVHLPGLSPRGDTILHLTVPLLDTHRLGSYLHKRVSGHDVVWLFGGRCGTHRYPNDSPNCGCSACWEDEFVLAAGPVTPSLWLSNETNQHVAQGVSCLLWTMVAPAWPKFPKEQNAKGEPWSMVEWGRRPEKSLSSSLTASSWEGPF